jgi:hypothetical protein
MMSRPASAFPSMNSLARGDRWTAAHSGQSQTGSLRNIQKLFCVLELKILPETDCVSSQIATIFLPSTFASSTFSFNLLTENSSQRVRRWTFSNPPPPPRPFYGMWWRRLVKQAFFKEQSSTKASARAAATTRIRDITVF